MSAEPKRVYSMDEYLALERESEVRYEYLNGEVLDMSGGKRYHDRIMGKMFNIYHGVIFPH